MITVASALVILASIAIFTRLYQSADHRIAVLTATTTIRQGQPIETSDLGAADVATSGGVATISASSASELSGKRAAVTIPAGSLITPGDVTSGRVLTAGTAVVGLALKDGQLPSNGVEPGDQVMLIQTFGVGSALPVTGSATAGPSDPGSAAGTGYGVSTGVLVAQAIVFETANPAPSSSSGASELVSVEVPSTLAAAVATAAAASQVSLVLLPAGTADASSGSP